MPIDPEPVNGLNIKNSVSWLGIPKKLNIGAMKPDMTDDKPLIDKSSTIAKIATRYGNVFMHKSTACLAPETKQS